MFKLTIDRNTWLRGESDSNLLRESDGKMCCLGQLSKQCNIADEVILDEGALNGPLNKDKLSTEYINHPVIGKLLKEIYKDTTANKTVYGSTDEAFKLMKINDRFNISEEEREKELVEEFKTIDIEVEFIN